MLSERKLGLYSILVSKSNGLTLKGFRSNPGVFTFLSYYSINIADPDVDYNKFTAIGMDGIQTVIFGRMFQLGRFERISFDFSSLASEVFKHHNQKNGKVVFIGSKTEDLASFLKVVLKRYPRLHVVYKSDGYFDSKHESKIIRDVLSAEPDLIVLGMGTKRQDSLALDLWEESNKELQIFTCGGFFHQTAMSNGDYFPQIINRLNIRFLYRIFKEKGTISKLFPDILYPLFFMYKLYRQK